VRKIYLYLMFFSLLVSSVQVAYAENTAVSDFAITNDGEITAYYGGEFVVVPSEVEGIPVIKIGERAFFDIGITDVYLSEGISAIGKSSFEGCNIVSADIPSSVRIIGDRAFANCAELHTVFTCFDENTVIGEDAFLGTGNILFYLDCDTDTKAIERKILKAKGDSNFDVSVRHVGAEYDYIGNVVCTVCGYRETPGYGDLMFEDVPRGSWYYEYVQASYAYGIINGKSETVFDPDSGMTCAEAAKIAASIYAINYYPIPEHTQGPWYQPYVDYCYSNGLIEEHITFDWEKDITRAQMAYIFSRTEPWAYYLNDVPITDIPDVHDTTPFAYEILDLYNKGVAVGDQTMAFHPDSGIKRSEAAALVARMMDDKFRIELPKG